MKKIINIIKWNFMPVIMVFGLTLVFSSIHLPYWVSLLFGFVIGYSTGLVTFKFKSNTPS